MSVTLSNKARNSTSSIGQTLEYWEYGRHVGVGGLEVMGGGVNAEKLYSCHKRSRLFLCDTLISEASSWSLWPSASLGTCSLCKEEVGKGLIRQVLPGVLGHG